MKNYEANVERQPELLSVKELNEKWVPAQRVNIVSFKMVMEVTLI